jgi:hypothetical protein
VLTFYSRATKHTLVAVSLAVSITVVLLPHTNGEHVQNRSSLNPTQEHYESNYAK